MNPQFIKTTNVDNNSDNTTETGSQQCMSDSVAETSCLGLGDEYLPKGHITTHPFSLTSEELSGLLNDGQVLCENSQTPEPLSNKDKRGCVENSTQLFPCKSIGGSGWLNKSTKLKSTKRGPVEYPRVKDHKRDPNNCSHWYWYYRWQKKGKNGKPLYKGDGSPVTECIYCPQKKVRAVERAILLTQRSANAARLPHYQILEIIKIYYSVDGIDLKGVRTVAGDFNNSDLGVRCNTPEVINTIVKEWKRLANNCLTIAFAVNIAHAKALAEPSGSYITTAFNEAGVKAASVDGTMPTKQREIIYSQLQSGKIKVVASCEALGEGFDIPAISCVLLCRPSKSKAKAWQQIGRGLRISPGKYDCLILDQAGMVTRFGFVEDLKSFTLGKSDKTPAGEAPTKICPKCSAINRNFDKVCGCCGYEYPVVPKLLPTKEFKLLRCTADKVKQYQHYHELLKEAYHQGFKPVWADDQYYSHYKQWPPYKWMRDAIFGSQPTVADKIAYRQYLIQLMVADRQAIGWVNHHMRMIFGEEYSMK